MDSGQHAEGKLGGVINGVISLVVMVVVVVVLSWGLRTFVFQPYEIPSGSMEQTIMTGDMVFSEKVTYYTRSIQQGDIVTFADPEVAGRTLIKRVIAVGGQTVNLVNGTVYVDGMPLTESYTNGEPSYPLDVQAPNVAIAYPYTVPAGCIWVMGDNRLNSQDSRYFGAVPASSVTGRAAVIYWPLDHLKVLTD